MPTTQASRKYSTVALSRKGMYELRSNKNSYENPLYDSIFVLTAFARRIASSSSRDFLTSARVTSVG